jgi:two-component system sensor histidine kinase YesM
MIRYIPEDVVFKSLNKFQLWYFGFSVFAVVKVFLYSISVHRYIQKPLTTLVDSFKKVQSGDISARIQHEGKDEFGYLYASFNDMAENLQNLIEQVYQQKILVQNAELRQLQAQINPHFLYNSYFLLHRMIKREDYYNAVRFSKLIGEYFQFVARNSVTEVFLRSEAEHARIYTDIQAVRFDGRIRIEFNDLPDESADIEVPKLILQPIIENAFVHGLENKVRDGLLIISFNRTRTGFAISVEDNGDELTDAKLAELDNNLRGEGDGIENTGLINIHKRIRLMYGAKSGISLSRANIGGLKATIFIHSETEAGNV